MRWPNPPSRRAVLGGSLLLTVALGIGFGLTRPASAEPEPEITLWSAEDQPLRSAWVELRCGKEHHRMVSNARGGIDLPGSCREVPTVEGFDLLRTERVGKESRFHFSPRGTLRFELLDLKGAPLTQVPATITLHHGTDGVTVGETVAGRMEFPDMPLALSTGMIQVFPQSRDWAVAGLLSKRSENGMVYSVRLERRRPVPVNVPADGMLS